MRDEHSRQEKKQVQGRDIENVPGGFWITVRSLEWLQQSNPRRHEGDTVTEEMGHWVRPVSLGLCKEFVVFPEMGAIGTL